MVLSPRLNKYFSDYDGYHQNKGNKLTHYLGIPLIVVTLFGLLGRVSIATIGDFEINAGFALGLFALAWYLAVDLKVGLLFSVVLALSYWLGSQLSTTLLWTMFIAGWTLQLVGHSFYEKKKPAFFKNAQHILIGPLWIFCALTGLRKVDRQ